MLRKLQENTDKPKLIQVLETKQTNLMCRLVWATLPRYLVKHILDVSVEMLLDEINI